MKHEDLKVGMKLRFKNPPENLRDDLHHLAGTIATITHIESDGFRIKEHNLRFYLRQFNPYNNDKLLKIKQEVLNNGREKRIL